MLRGWHSLQPIFKFVLRRLRDYERLFKIITAAAAEGGGCESVKKCFPTRKSAVRIQEALKSHSEFPRMKNELRSVLRHYLAKTSSCSTRTDQCFFLMPEPMAYNTLQYTIYNALF